MTAKEKVASLQEAMKKHKIEAFIVYSADPHMSEYLPLEWQERAWLSGFTGSAGFVVITQNKAALWTDGRYFTQAPKELEGSGIILMKDGVGETPNYIDWIISETNENAVVAANTLAASNANWETVEHKLEFYNRKLRDFPLLDEVWTDRGQPIKNPVFVHPIEKAGKSVQSKLTEIRKKMEEDRVSLHIISSLDDVAWTVNLRGSDVECNPVFLAYLTITPQTATLYVDKEKLTDNANQLMQESDVSIKPYMQFFADLKQENNQRILVSSNSNQAIFHAIEKQNTLVVKPVPGHLMKAVKNKAELAGFRTVMVRDGVAMVNFLYWLTHTVGKEELSEYQIGEKLEEFRAQQPNFIGTSFGSIVGFKGNGAIIHYSAPKKGSASVKNDASILVDSGGQYLEGTTDITRTFPLGKVSEQFKHDVTLVLKGLIRLSLVKFPKGTCGTHLDVLARQALWQEGKDYNHGTGHGVGCFLNVHEGPQSIRKDLTAIPLQEGMVLSNEPGYYPVGEYGIRHENLITVKEWKKTEWNTFYEFETLTLCPFFKSVLLRDLLTEAEITWLNDYHQMVKKKLLPHLKEEVKDWFLSLVSPL